MVVAVVALLWLALALGVALALGRAVRTADRRAPLADHLAGLPADLTVAHILGARTTELSH